MRVPLADVIHDPATRSPGADGQLLVNIRLSDE
jgi:hypothetical protein